MVFIAAVKLLDFIPRSQRFLRGSVGTIGSTSTITTPSFHLPPIFTEIHIGDNHHQRTIHLAGVTIITPKMTTCSGIGPASVRFTTNHVVGCSPRGLFSSQPFRMLYLKLLKLRQQSLYFTGW